MRPYVHLQVLRDRMIDACASYFMVRDAPDLFAPAVIEEWRTRAMAAIDAYTDELNAFERIRSEVHATHPLDPAHEN
jgi:hypothetical protein